MANFFDLLNEKFIHVARTPEAYPLINGDIDLSGSEVDSLPDNLLLSGSLILRDCPLTALPTGLNIMDSLDLRNTPITALAPDMSVGLDMMLENTRLTSLPDNLAVDGDLDLEDTLLTALPSNLCVGGYLNLRNTAVSQLPDDWFVDGPILLDVEKIRSPLAWRRVSLDVLAPDDHIMQDYFLDTSEVDRFFWYQSLHEQYVELFAVWVCGEIRVFTGGHVGTPGGFERLDISQIFRLAAQECVIELEEKLNGNADLEVPNAKF